MVKDPLRLVLAGWTFLGTVLSCNVHKDTPPVKQQVRQNQVPSIAVAVPGVHGRGRRSTANCFATREERVLQVLTTPSTSHIACQPPISQKHEERAQLLPHLSRAFSLATNLCCWDAPRNAVPCCSRTRSCTGSGQGRSLFLHRQLPIFMRPIKGFVEPYKYEH